jgi:23S rRNA (uridine2552-2'-O)-methyltransferase
MAPNFSGTLFETHIGSLELNKLCLELCIALGTEQCNLVMKTIEGEHEKQLVMLLEHFYKGVFRFKPKSSRKESSEHYLVCKDLEIPNSDR